MTDILTNLEIAIRSEQYKQPEPLPGDKWLVSSAMQKAVRRGEVETAIRAATALWLQDRQNFWRRLHIIALEDVSIGNPDNVAVVLTATASPLWRRSVGDLRVGLHLVRLLCGSVKSRAADELFLCLERSQCYRPMQVQFAKASDSLLTAYVEDSEEPLTTRAMALWYLCGTTKMPSNLIPQRKGSFEEAAKVLRSLKNVPAELVEGCVGVMSRTQWPLSIFVPLLWQEAEKERSRMQMKAETLAPSHEVEGIPDYACDMFTRIGQSCFRQLQRAVPELEMYNVPQIGITTFYREGGLLDNAVTSPAFHELQLAGEMADVEHVGLDVPDYLALRDCLMRHADMLNDIRREQLHRYLNGAGQ